MIELLVEAAKRDATTVAALRRPKQITYGQALESARVVASELRRREISRFAVVDADPCTVVPILAGASLAGVEACLYPPTANPEMAAGLADRFDHEYLVTDRSDLAGAYEVIQPQDLIGAPLGEVGDLEPLPGARPHLVLTTGTTGAPRAVCHDWSRLLSGAKDTAQAPDERWLLAYGMNQFGGLQILIHVAAVGATLIAADSFQPKAGLEAMREHGVTHASATPTFWRFLLAELKADGGPVPALSQITLGGEAVPESVLADLHQVFPQARITQIYAANEFGRIASVRDMAKGIPDVALEAHGDVQLKVVDGELWVRTRGSMLGYYGEEPVDPNEWRPTGDLVERTGDRWYFQGRESEVINVGGVKVHPLPVEERIGALAGVAMSRVYGRKSALTGAIVAVEVVAEPGVDPEELDAAIRKACSDLPPASRPRSIRVVDEIVTVGHKIIRKDHNQESING